MAEGHHQAKSSGEDDSYNDDIEYLEAAFHLIDQDHDGLIDRSDLIRLMARLNVTVTDVEVAAMIEAQQTPGTNVTPGCLDFGGFCAMMRRGGLRRNLDSGTKHIFGTMDRNNDGSISVEDLRSVTRAIGIKLTDSEVDQMFNAADTDQDGRITFEEFGEMIKVLQQLDNRNGKDKK